jgi:hypothetical protein
MKTLFTAIALTALIATPVLAQTTRNQTNRAVTARAQAAPATAPGAVRRLPGQAQDVFDISGNYLGSDPDPKVRAMLAMDPTGGD